MLCSKNCQITATLAHFSLRSFRIIVLNQISLHHDGTKFALLENLILAKNWKNKISVDFYSCDISVLDAGNQI